LTPPAEWQVVMRWPCWQMVAPSGLDAPAVEDLEVLGARDGEDMLALTDATRPGPFLRRTHELGHYVGVRAGGRLIAMAGERLRVPGATEISAVCTDPAYQRRGLAAALVRVLAARIQARGETAFLHVATDNVGAIRVYEALGFVRRAAIEAIALRAPA
jgi:predicted GNAT family acetyltransferase